MKFVCDNCNAKYQIGDDKVAGKTLRMKCRRCGHLIQVAATVTESSVSQKLPTEPVAGSAAAPPQRQPPAAQQARPGLDQRALEDEGATGFPEEGATIVRQSPLFLFQNGEGGIPAPAPSATSIPRPTGPKLVPPARASRASMPPGASPFGPAPTQGVPPAAQSQAQQRPPPRAPVRPSPGGLQAVALNQPHLQAVPTAPMQAPAPMHAPSSPGLYGGFAQAVAAQVTPMQGARSIGEAPVPTEDWYVGIGGVPLGPVRLSVLRDKAAQGQVDSDSLVWREGLDEWQAIKNFPGLMAVVEEAKHQRTSRTSAVMAAPVALSAGSPAIGSPSMGSPSMGAPAASGRSAASMLAASSSMTAQMPEPAASHPFDLVRQSVPDGSAGGASFGGPSPVPSDPGAHRDASPPLVAVDPFSASAGATVIGANGANGSGYGLTTTAAISQDAARASLAPASIPPKKKGVHPMVWAFVAMAAAFGGVAAWALFVRAPTVVEVPPSNAGTMTTNVIAPPPPPEATSTGESVAPTTSDAVAVASGSPTVVWGPKGPVTVSAKPGETVAPLDTSKFGPNGPKTAETTGTSTSGGGEGGPLSEGQANGVVASNTPRVRRKCWDSISGSRSADAPKSVRVNVSINVAPSGKVTSAGASGGNEKHYPGLTSCVQSTVAGWTFPTSGEGGKFSVPFNFSVQ